MPLARFPLPDTGGVDMKSHMDGEVKWVLLLTTLAIVYVVGFFANA